MDDVKVGSLLDSQYLSWSDELKSWINKYTDDAIAENKRIEREKKLERILNK